MKVTTPLSRLERNLKLVRRAQREIDRTFESGESNPAVLARVAARSFRTLNRLMKSAYIRAAMLDQRKAI
jgi:hypothetical protein